MGVSVITTVISFTTLAACTLGLGLAAWLANVVATGVATVTGQPVLLTGLVLAGLVATLIVMREREEREGQRAFSGDS